MTSGTDALKRAAAARALESVRDGMVLGLGTGSTIRFFLDLLGERVRAGDLSAIVGVPTSRRTAEIARGHGIRISRLRAQPRLDLTVDGADEVDPAFNLIKGGGGAHLREKIVAQATERLVIVADDSKLVDQLGASWALPVEVIPFGWESQAAYLASLGASPTLRMDGDTPFETDQGNLILDANFGRITDPAALDATLNARAGIVEHGLFIGMAHDVVVAGADDLRHLRKA